MNVEGSLHAAAVIRALRKKNHSSALPTAGAADGWDDEDEGWGCAAPVAIAPAAAVRTLAASALGAPSRAAAAVYPRSAPALATALAQAAPVQVAAFNALVAETAAERLSLAGTSAGGVKYSADELLFYRDHLGGLKVRACSN
jgi:hypothetical protein